MWGLLNEALVGTFLATAIALSVLVILAGLTDVVVRAWGAIISSIALIALLNTIIVVFGGFWLEKQPVLPALIDGVVWGLAIFIALVVTCPKQQFWLYAAVAVLAFVHMISEFVSRIMFGTDVFVDVFGCAMRATIAATVIAIAGGIRSGLKNHWWGSGASRMT